MRYQILILIGMAMMIEGFSSTFYSYSILSDSTSPPLMRSLEGMDYVIYIYKQIFLASGIVGIVVTFAGIFFWRKKMKI